MWACFWPNGTRWSLCNNSGSDNLSLRILCLLVRAEGFFWRHCWLRLAKQSMPVSIMFPSCCCSCCLCCVCCVAYVNDQWTTTTKTTTTFCFVEKQKSQNNQNFGVYTMEYIFSGILLTVKRWHSQRTFLALNNNKSYKTGVVDVSDWCLTSNCLLKLCWYNIILLILNLHFCHTFVGQRTIPGESLYYFNKRNTIITQHISHNVSIFKYGSGQA